MEPTRISPTDALGRIRLGKALMVCAYPDMETCSKMWLRAPSPARSFKPSCRS